MSKPNRRRRLREMNRRVAQAISGFSLLALTVPAALAQTNSPGTGQPTDTGPGPAQGGASNHNGISTGGDATAGNRSTLGQAGATGRGSGAPAVDDSSGGGSSVIALVVVGVVVLIGVAILVSSRHRRLERVEAT